jgi:rare lipoprotein A (peptidoglycan hydrolase)
MMRTIFKSMLALLPLALFAQSPAHAAAEGWRQSCSGPAYVCGGASAATKKVADRPAKSVKAAKVKANKPVDVSSDDTPVKVKAKKKVADAPIKAKTKVAKAAVDNDDEDAPKSKKSAKASKGGGSVYQSGMASWYGGNFK